jgi:hypothetical protein
MSVKPKWTKDFDDQINYTCEALDNLENPLVSWRTFNTSKHKLVDGGARRIGGGSQRNVPLNEGGESLVSNLSYSFNKMNPQDQTNGGAGGPGGPMGDSFNNDPMRKNLPQCCTVNRLRLQVKVKQDRQSHLRTNMICMAARHSPVDQAPTDLCQQVCLLVVHPRRCQ